MHAGLLFWCRYVGACGVAILMRAVPSYNLCGAAAPNCNLSGVAAPDYNLSEIAAPNYNVFGIRAPNYKVSGVAAAVRTTIRKVMLWHTKH